MVGVVTLEGGPRHVPPDRCRRCRHPCVVEVGRRRTKLHLRRQGDGTTRISGLLRDAIADRLATHLQAFTNPRQRSETHEPAQARQTGGRGESGEPTDQQAGGADSPGNPFTRLSYPRRLGHAFCRLLETLDPHRQPLHGGDATTVVITVPLASLLTDLATADLLTSTHVPGNDTTDHSLTAAQARRLACTAHLIPAVLDADSEILDLGRTQRLFTRAQRRALLLRDRECGAEGCDIPGTWCDAHHWVPWSTGGPTDLTNGVLLCAHHHHRAHDPGFEAERQPTGDVRFHRRT